MDSDKNTSDPGSLSGSTTGIKRTAMSELQLREKLSIVWGWYWRGLLLAIVIAVLSSLLGSGMMRIAVSSTAGPMVPRLNILMYVQWAITLLMGFIGLFILIKWILKSSFGAYRVWLVKSGDPRR